MNYPLHESLVKVMDAYYKVENRVEYLINPLQSFRPEKATMKKNMKILYVTFLKYPNTGGLANYITTLKTGFEKCGHEIKILSPLQMPIEYFERKIPQEAQNIRFFLKKRYGISNEKIIKNVSFLNVFAEFLQGQNLEEYDIFHAQDLFAIFIMGQLNERYRKPLFFTPHGHFTKSRLKFDKIQRGSIEEIHFREIEKQGIRAANQIITISNSFHEPLQEYGAKKEQLITVHTGINLEKIVTVKKKDEEKILICCVARLSPRKGHDILLKALSEMKVSLSNVEVWIVGDGSMRSELERQAQILGLENVKFLGKRTDIAEILAISDIYILPTINDNFPLSILEAMFSGKAIITTNCGGIVEMIQNRKTGIICEPGNVSQITESLTLLLQNKRLRSYLGKNAKEYADRNFTQAIMVSKIEEIYRRYV
ncbi:glycosyltransferase family 4 protein [Bacillus clarus]|nr:glycosyltransferase family 4 protein [Bacillus clarus]